MTTTIQLGKIVQANNKNIAVHFQFLASTQKIFEKQILQPRGGNQETKDKYTEFMFSSD